MPVHDSGYAAAAVSEWTTRVVAFARWVGPGRRLTQSGRLTLAHARELRAAVGVLARFGAVRLDGPQDALRVAFTPLARAAMPTCW